MLSWKRYQIRQNKNLFEYCFLPVVWQSIINNLNVFAPWVFCCLFKFFSNWLLVVGWITRPRIACSSWLFVDRSKQWDVIMKFHCVQPFKKATASKVCSFVWSNYIRRWGFTLCWRYVEGYLENCDRDVMEQLISQFNCQCKS